MLIASFIQKCLRSFVLVVAVAGAAVVDAIIAAAGCSNSSSI